MKSKFLLKRRPRGPTVLKTYNCSVCYEKKSCSTKALLPCGHEFCKGCIDKWRKQNNSCPLCRKTFSNYKYQSRCIKVESRRPDKFQFFELVITATTDFLENEECRERIRKDLLERKPGMALLMVCIYRSLQIIGEEENRVQFNEVDINAAIAKSEELMELIESQSS